MPPDILAAVTAYLQAAMGGSLLSESGYPQAFADSAPTVNPDGSGRVQPYAVVYEGPESYAMSQSDDPETGFRLSVISDGTLQVAFYATTKAQARALCRTAVALLSDTRIALDAADGRVVTLLPTRSDTVEHRDEGIQQPTSFIRVLTVEYRQQFLE